jgi:hypothetical protein
MVEDGNICYQAILIMAYNTLPMRKKLSGLIGKLE